MKNKHITESTLPSIIDALQVANGSDKEYQVSITLFDDSRKGRQRALANIWYSQIEKELGWSVGEAEAYCKYTWGLKIACSTDLELNKIVRRMLDGYDYEQKLEIIRKYPEWFPVLRKNKGLCAEGQALYLTEIQRDFANQHVILTSINDKDLLNCKEANR